MNNEETPNSMISRRQIAVIFCTFAILLFAPNQLVPALAADEGAGAFVSRLGEATIAKLTDVSLTPSVREAQFRDLLREGFAVRTIGQFVLGKYRRTAPRAQIEEFIDVFEEYVVSLYAKQFKHYSGQQFRVENVAATSRTSDKMVMTKIFPNGGAEPLRVNFQVRNFENTFKILDVRVEGVSMVLAQRDEFTSYIATHGDRVESLIDALRQRIAAGAVTAGK